MKDGQGNRLERDQDFGQCSFSPFFSPFWGYQLTTEASLTETVAKTLSL